MSRSFSFFVSLFLCVAISTAASAQSPVGTWDVNVDAGGSYYPSVLTLTEQADSLTGTFASAGGPGIALQNVRFASDTLNFEFDTPDYGRMTVHAVISENALNGFLSMSFGDFPMTGTRKVTATLSTKSLIADLLENEQAKAVLEKHVPGLTTNPQLQQALNMSVQDIAPYAPETFTEQVLKAIDEDLSKL